MTSTSPPTTPSTANALLTPATLGLGLSGRPARRARLLAAHRSARGPLVLLDDRPTRRPRHRRRPRPDPARDPATAGSATGSRSSPPASPPTWSSAASPGPGWSHRKEKRGLLGTKVRFVPADPFTSGWPATRIRIAATRGELLDISDLVLTGLVLATGLDQHVLVTLEPGGRDQLFDQLRRRLPAMLQHLVGHAEAAVGDAVMARRA